MHFIVYFAIKNKIIFLCSAGKVNMDMEWKGEKETWTIWLILQ